jgi:hypothetical protein
MLHEQGLYTGRSFFPRFLLSRSSAAAACQHAEAVLIGWCLVSCSSFDLSLTRPSVMIDGCDPFSEMIRLRDRLKVSFSKWARLQTAARCPHRLNAPTLARFRRVETGLHPLLHRHRRNNPHQIRNRSDHPHVPREVAPASSLLPKAVTQATERGLNVGSHTRRPKDAPPRRRRRAAPPF